MDQSTNSGRGFRSFRGSRVSGRGRGANRGAMNRLNPGLEQQRASSTVVSTTANTPTSTNGTTTPLESDSLIKDDPASHLSDQKFSDLKGQVDQRLLDAIPFDYMSSVQAATLSTALSGKDVLAQAKTGTGKTLAFLIPAIQKLCALPTSPPQKSVSILVLSPTRELALQIEKEAVMLLRNLEFGVQHVVGGTNITTERKRLVRDRKDLLIATPGRLIDHLENGGEGLDLKKSLADLKVLVLDEADRMLDMGFRRDLEKIMKLIPDPMQGREGGRQSLFFSATIPSFVHEVAKLKPDHVFISTLKEGEENTHLHVPQEFRIVPIRDMLATALQIVLAEAIKSPVDHKVIIFSPTARETSLAAEIFRMVSALDKQTFSSLGPIYEIHSRKSQSARTKTMTDFKASSNGVLFSSDVTARGVDIPNLSIVMQLGLPSDAEQYIHRLGRTARAGKEGRGVLVLDPSEQWFVTSKGMKDLPLQKIEEEVDATQLNKCKHVIQSALSRTDETIKSQAYQAHLGYYKQFIKSMKWTPTELIRQTNLYARHALLWQVPPHQSTNDPESIERGWTAPPLLARTVGLMGLKGLPGLNIVKELPPKSGGGGDNTSNSNRHGHGNGNGNGGSLKRKNSTNDGRGGSGGSGGGFGRRGRGRGGQR